MSFFVVIRKPIKDSLLQNNVKNPSQEELLKDLQSYPHVFLLSSLDDANKVAEIFFQSPQKNRISGSYGLVAEVTAIFTRAPIWIQVDGSAFYNNWVHSQKTSYDRKAACETTYPCVLISPKEVESILSSHIPRNAKAYNAKLRSTDFTSVEHQCVLL